jgi:Flp pilus assembly protein TadD
MLASPEEASGTVNLPWTFAEGLLRTGVARDSLGAIEALLAIAADPGREAQVRLASARRAWDVYQARLAEREGAPRVMQSLKGIPPEQWPPELRIGVARGLRLAGKTNDARVLIEAEKGAGGSPELALEQALNDLRDGPPSRALSTLHDLAPSSPEARFRYAEALFYAGECDSALAWYQRIAEDPDGTNTGAALERIYLIEDGNPRAAVQAMGRIAYEDWRGNSKSAMALADSLYHALPRGPLWAQAAIQLSVRREQTGDIRGALQPLLVVADSLPGDRLAPLARQRAGDIYLTRLKDDASALAQYEECLARYPRAWNAAEVRRKLEALRREKRF